jgi:hypothetical protein
MDISRYLILAILVAAVLAVTGCTTTNAPMGTATTTPSSSLASLALSPTDVPANYTLSESREKNASDVSKIARDLGWEAGYEVTYTNNTVTPYGQTKIIQTITRYPSASIPDIMDLLVKQEQTDPDMDYANIPDLGIGDRSGGYTATPHAQMIIKPVESKNPLVGGSTQLVMTKETAEIWFSKGTIFEVIRMTGPGSDAASVTNLARAAYAKIS